jgi:hypothetical protein
MAYEDFSCAASKYGPVLDTKSLADATEQLGPFNVVAGKPFVFAADYMEARIAQNKECSYTASFVPAPGQSYVVRFAAVNQVQGCGVQVSDGNGSKVAYKAPELSCVSTFAGRVRNGGAGVLNWGVQTRIR